MRNLLCVLTLISAASCIKPCHRFESYLPPVEPDYGQPDDWAALPDKKDSADAIPLNSGLIDNQANALVDVFFVHPTSYLGRSWNADLTDKKLNVRTDRGTIRLQASVYNGSCRIYAPRYRQATLYSFFDKKNGPKALDLAYEDVKAAFEYYLVHFNNGRPIIIASHSQGTHHALRLMKNYFDQDTALYEQLVAAYLIGGPVEKKAFRHIMPCDSATQIHCYIAWNTMVWGHDQRRKNDEVVNPLTWTRDTAYVGAQKNLGGVAMTFDRIDTGLVGAKGNPNGTLWVKRVRKKGYPRIFTNYHISDYNLFYMSIRENVEQRISAYVGQHQP